MLNKTSASCRNRRNRFRRFALTAVALCTMAAVCLFSACGASSSPDAGVTRVVG